MEENKDITPHKNSGIEDSAVETKQIDERDTLCFEHKVFFNESMHISLPRAISFRDLVVAIGEELSRLGYISVDGAR